MNLARGRLTLSVFTMDFTLLLKGMMRSSTSGEHMFAGFLARMLGMHAIDPTPAITNLRAPRMPAAAEA
uniref:Uncharacterized protein n=3 Tax=Oryza TaxID=4527 RepID=A0A0E0DRI4_9ORYZ